LIPNSKAKAVDPAGLDNLLLAAGKGCARFLEHAIGQKLGRPVSFWDGPDGLGAFLSEEIKAAGIPNARLPELLTPRAVLTPIFRRPKRNPAGRRKAVR